MSTIDRSIPLALNQINDKRIARAVQLAFDRVAQTASVTATGTSSQTDSAAIEKAVNYITTSSASTKGVRLPTPQPNDPGIWLLNTNATYDVLVYPDVGGTINGLSANAAYTLPAGQACIVIPATGTQWYLGTIGATSAQIAYLTGSVAGTGAASKTVVLGADGNFVMPADSQFELSNATPAAAGTGVSAADATALTAQINAVTGADGTVGVALPAAADGLAIYIANTSASAILKVWPVASGNDAINALGANTVFNMGAGKAAWFVATSATQWYAPDTARATATTTELNFLGGATAGTQVASKAVVADANVNTGVSKVTQLWVGASGSEVQVSATPAELNRVAQTSTRIVTTTASVLALTVTQHAERLVLVNSNTTFANTFTLPVATGSGAKFQIINNVVQTQGTVVIAANGTDVLQGTCFAFDTTATADAGAFQTSATSDKVTLNLTTTGGLGGDQVEAWDIAANTWKVRVVIVGSGSLGTPFSQT